MDKKKPVRKRKTAVPKTAKKAAVKKRVTKKQTPDRPAGYTTGRPTKYKKEYCEIPIRLGREGKTAVHIAAEIMVSRETIYEWGRVHPEFSDALQKGKAIAHAWHVDRMMNATSTVEYNVSKWFLAACFSQSEVQKIEQEITQHVDSKVEFCDREDDT